ncbi:MAG: hypothetical protein ACYDHN_00260 [Solirubrobacteraceae bacterium]
MRRKDVGRAAPPLKRYGSLASFYTADSRRIRSRELDVGLWWREGEHGPLHRAAWVSDTGELYLVRLGPDTAGGGRVEVLATVEDRERLESVLEGWREHCGEPRSLAWLRGRAARLGVRARVTQARMGASTTAAVRRVRPSAAPPLALG